MTPVFEHRLLLLAETFPPSVGGIQAYLSGLWDALPAKQSFVITAPQPGDQEWDARQPYRILRVPMRAWTYPRWRTAWQAARELVRKERIEAVVCGKALFEGRAALKLQAEFGIPFVVCTYSLEIETWLAYPRTHAHLLNVLRNAGRVVVINEEVKQRLLAHNVPDARIAKIYPGVREDWFSPPSELEAFRARLGLNGKRVITAVTRLVPRKGVRVLLDAFAEVHRDIPAAHLLIVGDGPERANLKQQAARGGLTSAVTFLGNVSDDDVRRAVAVGDVFVLTPLDLPEDREGFGIVYLEAAALGKPAVASRTGGIPEAVLDGETGLLVEPSNVQDTAQALKTLLTNDELRIRLGTQARARAHAEFHWKGRALLFQGMVHALLSEQGTGRSEQPRTPVH